MSLLTALAAHWLQQSRDQEGTLALAFTCAPAARRRGIQRPLQASQRRR